MSQPETPARPPTVPGILVTALAVYAALLGVTAAAAIIHAVTS